MEFMSQNTYFTCGGPAEESQQPNKNWHCLAAAMSTRNGDTNLPDTSDFNSH